jgi:hypothetical protein
MSQGTEDIRTHKWTTEVITNTFEWSKEYRPDNTAANPAPPADPNAKIKRTKHWQQRVVSCAGKNIRSTHLFESSQNFWQRHNISSGHSHHLTYMSMH